MPTLKHFEHIHFQYGLYSAVDAGYFQHRYTNFGHTNLGMPKFNLKSYLNYQKEKLQLFDYIDNIKIIMKK